jgi:hypothetical protein
MTASLPTLWALCAALGLSVGGLAVPPPPLDDVDASEADQAQPEDAETPAGLEGEEGEVGEMGEVIEPEPAPEPASVPRPVPDPGPTPGPEHEPAHERLAQPPAPGGYEDIDDLRLQGRDEEAARNRKVGRDLRVAGTVINGVGVGLLAAAGVLFVMRHRSVNDLDAAAADLDPAEREGPVTEIEERERMAMILGVAAGATLVVGTTLWIAGNRRIRRALHHEAALPSPVVGRGLAGLAWRGRF